MGINHTAPKLSLKRSIPKLPSMPKLPSIPKLPSYQAIFEASDTKATFEAIDTKATFEAIPTVFAGSFCRRAEDIVSTIYKRGGRTLKISDPITGFRLPKTMLAKVDSLCVPQDLTRSQVFRRSITEYLKGQNAIGTDVNQPEPQRSWPEELFECEHRM